MKKLNILTKMILCAMMLVIGLFMNPMKINAEETSTYAVAQRVYFDETYANDDYYFECEHENISFTIKIQGEYTLTSGNITYASMSGSINKISNYRNIDVVYVSTSTRYTSKTITVYVTVRYMYDGVEKGSECLPIEIVNLN